MSLPVVPYGGVRQTVRSGERKRTSISRLFARTYGSRNCRDFLEMRYPPGCTLSFCSPYKQPSAGVFIVARRESTMGASWVSVVGTNREPPEP